jgi:hypothetical protein
MAGRISHVRIVRRAQRAAFASAEVAAICDGLRAQDPAAGSARSSFFTLNAKPRELCRLRAGKLPGETRLDADDTLSYE